MISDAEFNAALLEVLTNILLSEKLSWFYQFSLQRIAQAQAEARTVGVNLSRHNAFKVVVVQYCDLINLYRL